MRWLKLWHRQQRFIRLSLKKTHLYRVFGERVFHSHLWAMDKAAMAGGLSLGLFIAFTPTIPFQMLLCTLGALFFRVNLPVALAACWLTNPATALPIYLAARKLGKHLFEETPALLFVLDLFRFQGRGKRFIEESIYLWTGCLIFGSLVALAGNILIRIAARVLVRARQKELFRGGPDDRKPS